MTFSQDYSCVINLMIKGIKKYYAKNSCIGEENAGSIEMTYFMFEK